MRYFQNVDGLSDLEKQERWEDARLLLYKNWMYNKICANSLIRLLAECWYVLSLWDCCIDTEHLSFQAFQDTLLETVTYGIEHFSNCQKFLCMAGYMIYMLPYLFCTEHSNISYSDWENTGIHMLHRAKNCMPHDAVSDILNLGLSSDQVAFRKAKEKLSSELDNLFPKETAVEGYFNNILSITGKSGTDHIPSGWW